MCIGSVVVMSLDLKSAVNADANLVISSLLKLIENKFECKNCGKYSSIGWRELGASKCADGVAIIKMFIKTSNPFAARVTGSRRAAAKLEGHSCGSVTMEKSPAMNAGL